MQGHNSQPIKEDDIHKVVAFLHEYPRLIEEAKTAAEKAELHAELILSHLTLRAEGKSHNEREMRAKVQPEYKAAKEEEIVSRSREIGIKAQYTANELLASLYQTQSANMRSTKV